MLIKNSPCNAYVVLLLLVAMSNLHFVIHFIFSFVLCTLILLYTLHDSLDENKKRREILGLRFHGYGWSKLKILKTSVLALFWDKTRANWSIVSKWRPCLLLSNRWERLRHTFCGVGLWTKGVLIQKSKRLGSSEEDQYLLRRQHCRPQWREWTQTVL